MRPMFKSWIHPWLQRSPVLNPRFFMSLLNHSNFSLWTCLALNNFYVAYLNCYVWHFNINKSPLHHSFLIRVNKRGRRSDGSSAAGCRSTAAHSACHSRPRSSSTAKLWRGGGEIVAVIKKKRGHYQLLPPQNKWSNRKEQSRSSFIAGEYCGV